MYVDLHLHTIHSDGKLQVEDTIDAAYKKGIELLSITDHDTINGVNKAIEYSRMKNITCISGVELSCRNENSKITFPRDVSIHILGYNIDCSCIELQEYLINYHVKRKLVLNELIFELNDRGFEVNYDDIGVIAGKQMRIQDVVNHINSCFLSNQKKKRYINIAQSYYARLFAEDSSLEDGVKLIKKAGGIAVLAHAFFSYRDYNVELNSYLNVHSLLNYLCEIGIDGVEAFYPKYTIEQSAFLQKEADSRGIIVTAGSDFHGTTLRKEMMNKNIEQMRKTEKLFLEFNRYR